MLQNSESSLSYTIALVSVNVAYTVMPKKKNLFFENHRTLLREEYNYEQRTVALWRGGGGLVKLRQKQTK